MPPNGDAGRPWRAVQGGVVLRVRLTPKSSKDAVEGVESTVEGPAFKARVRAVPAEGAANEALARLFADWLGVPRTSVALTQGSKSRVKSLLVDGAAQTIEQRLAEKLATLGSSN